MRLFYQRRENFGWLLTFDWPRCLDLEYYSSRPRRGRMYEPKKWLAGRLCVGNVLKGCCRSLSSGHCPVCVLGEESKTFGTQTRSMCDADRRLINWRRSTNGKFPILQLTRFSSFLIKCLVVSLRTYEVSTSDSQYVPTSDTYYRVLRTYPTTHIRRA
jgi:hypothetical protein